jgi:tetratricopeptide (TPR) repeat protein
MDDTVQEVLSRLRERLADESWPSELAVLAQQRSLSISDVRSLVADLTWAAREQGLPYSTPPGNASPVVSGEAPTWQRLVEVYAYSYRLRYDFRARQLWRDCQRWPDLWEESSRSDALVVALASFGALGSGDLYLDKGKDLVDTVLRLPDLDHRTRHVLLMALQIAPDFTSRNELMLRISTEIIDDGGADSNVYFRKAWALRGLRRYDEASGAIARAIDLLPPGNNAVHQDYIRERELIVTSRQLDEKAQVLMAQLSGSLARDVDDRLERARIDADIVQRNFRQEVESKLDEARELVSEGLLRIVEILGLFLAVVGFIIASGLLVIDAQSFEQRVLAMVVVLVGALGFFLLLRLAVRLGARPREKASRSRAAS